MKKVTDFYFLLILLILPVLLIAGENPDVFLTGLRIVGPGHGLNGSELMAFNQQSGTTLALIVKAPENRKIVEIDDDHCSLVEFNDNLGYNMLDAVRWDGFPDISKDGKVALIEVSSKRQPSENAGKIHARGKIQMRVAASFQTQKINNLKMQAGSNAVFQKETIQLMKAQVEDENFTLVLQISRELRDNMQDIRFFTLDGNLLECWGQGSFSFGNATQMEYNINSKTVPEYLNIEIDIWQELETLDVPFDIETGLGFISNSP